MSVELPSPDIRVSAFGEIEPINGRTFVMGDFFTADQMRAMREEGYRAGLEEAARICETLNHGAFGPPHYLNGIRDGSIGCAAAIRAEKEKQG